MKYGKILPQPTVKKRLACAKEHLQGLWKYKGVRGIRQSRKHLAWYCKGFVGASQLRDKLSRIETVEEGISLIDQLVISMNNEQLTIKSLTGGAVALATSQL